MRFSQVAAAEVDTTGAVDDVRDGMLTDKVCEALREAEVSDREDADPVED